VRVSEVRWTEDVWDGTKLRGGRRVESNENNNTCRLVIKLQYHNLTVMYLCR
jgi:hypothetical protein